MSVSIVSTVNTARATNTAMCVERLNDINVYTFVNEKRISKYHAEERERQSVIFPFILFVIHVRDIQFLNVGRQAGFKFAFGLL